MFYQREVVLPVSADAVDLPEWLFSMTTDDYGDAAKGHRGIGTLGGAARTGMINVESVGGSLLIQHYATRLAEKHHVTMVSDASRAYLLHLVPLEAKVVWDMQLVSSGPDTSRFRCAIDVTLPTVVHLLGLTIGTPLFVRRHLVEETDGFGRDIVRKYGRQP